MPEENRSERQPLLREVAVEVVRGAPKPEASPKQQRRTWQRKRSDVRIAGALLYLFSVGSVVWRGWESTGHPKCSAATKQERVSRRLVFSPTRERLNKQRRTHHQKRIFFIGKEEKPQ